ncbi:cadherin-13 isoform X1, partial [Clarias magur]
MRGEKNGCEEKSGSEMSKRRRKSKAGGMGLKDKTAVDMIREDKLGYCGGISPMVFDDCEGNKDVKFKVSHPDFLIDKDLNLVPRRDVVDSGTGMFIHWVNDLVDDTAQVDIIGPLSQSTHTLREVLGVAKMIPNRSKRSLLVPPMFVPENQRAPFPRSIGKSHVISSSMKEDHIFRLTGKGADQDPKGVFSINKLTGEVAVSRALDREAIASYRCILGQPTET